MGMIFFPLIIWETFNPQEFNINVLLVVIIPIIIFEYPSVSKMFGARAQVINPFSFIYEKIRESRYRKLRQTEQENEREALERMERIIRMQTEEAERQRQYEREARERAQYQQRQQSQNQNSQQKQNHSNTGQDKQKAKTEKPSSQDPYEVLGVTRDMGKVEIRKAYLKLMNQYAPDRVSHLSEEFQKMAHEKCIAFNLAWEQIQKEKWPPCIFSLSSFPSHPSPCGKNLLDEFPKPHILKTRRQRLDFS